jgi:hypothetical protein
VPAPDPIARDYILLGLRLDQHLPGLVDGYYGPADLKAQVDIGEIRSPARLRDDAAALRARLASEVVEADRVAWLDAQLVALEAQAAAAAGEPLPYLEHVARCFDLVPARRSDSELDAAATALEALVPGAGALADRLDAWDAQFEVAVDRLPATIDWLAERLRARAATLFGLPEGEGLRVSLVRNQPWSGYNWYDGGRRSRIDLNVDLPRRVPELLNVMAHEAYPGHHLEHGWKETDLVEAAGRLEASILLIDTPECLISEGLANLGRRFVAAGTELVDLIVELCERAGLALAADPVALRDAAERSVPITAHRHALAASAGNAAFLRHVDGRRHAEVLGYLQDVGRFPAPTAAKRLEFIEHPRWRSYVFVYAEGEAMLATWLEAVPEAERVARFGRLLHEQLTPSAIRAPG